MSREIADAALHERVRKYLEQCYRPGELQFHSIVQAVAHPSRDIIAFSGPMYKAGGGFPVTRVGLVRPGAALTLLAAGAGSDSDPQWSPDGRRLAFLSDRDSGGGNFQLLLTDPDDADRFIGGPLLNSEVAESYAWSADSRRILLQSADSGADAAGSASAVQIGGRGEQRPDWLPTVETGSHDNLWRYARIWDSESKQLTVVGSPGQNVWEASWCGRDAVVAILSSSPTEGGWYQTYIGIASAAGGAFVPFATPELELAKVTGSPDGRHVAVIEGRFHRTVALGSLVIYAREDSRPFRPEVGTEVSSLTWRDSDRLFFAGMQAPQTVAGTYDLAGKTTAIEWRSSGTAGRKVPAAWPVGARGLTLPGHAFDRYPYIARVADDGTESVALDMGNDAIRRLCSGFQAARAVSWRARDGLEIQGYLALPVNVACPPLVLFIHGGPSHLFRDSWSFDNPLAALLVDSGYAVLCPNPRGSSGRGLEFASRVIGDMAGEDAFDLLAGVDHVLANYRVDARRLFVMGGSYGGYMTCWLIGHTERFAAACAIAPLTDMRSQFFTAHHPEFLALYSGGAPYETGGVFDDRSPLMHAHKVTTPTLLMAGERDKTTPPSQAVQFHHALVLRGTPSQLALYPQEGHAAGRFEAQIDQGARVLQWFRRWGNGRPIVQEKQMQPEYNEQKKR